MTATNHALTGAAIAMLVKRPELAIPAAFLSHFILDTIPHYNPPTVTGTNFKNFSENYARKLQSNSFRIIFPVDMLLFLAVLIVLPLLAPLGVSALTVFLSAIAGAAPDFDGGLRFLLRRLGIMRKRAQDNYWFNRFHLRLQWAEAPWGIYIELAWLLFIVWAISKLIQ